jgi:hypothetical protein
MFILQRSRYQLFVCLEKSLVPYWHLGKIYTGFDESFDGKNTKREWDLEGLIRYDCV